MKFTKILTLMVGALLFASIAMAATEYDNMEKPQVPSLQNTSGYNALEGADKIIEQQYSISLFRKVMETADLKDMIKYDADKAGFTVFVPTDRAMSEDISKDRLNELLTNKEQARYFVMFHMIDGRKSWEDLKAMNGMEVNSMSQTKLLFITTEDPMSKDLMKATRVLVNGASIQGKMYEGVHNISAYVIDAVVTP